jgi:uncharacterized membrane protein YvbJ
MALIKCEECGKEISDKAASCPHCGCPLNSNEKKELEVMNKTNLIKNILKKISLLKNNKKVAGIFIGVIVVLSVIIIYMNSLSDEEKYVLEIVEKAQNMQKNPDSFTMRSNISVVTYLCDGKKLKYVFFDTSGENSFGATDISTPCFVNQKFLCLSDNLPTSKDYMGMCEFEARDFLGLELALAQWELYGEKADEKKEEDIIEAYEIDAKKIAKKMKVECKID